MSVTGVGSSGTEDPAWSAHPVVNVGKEEVKVEEKRREKKKKIKRGMEREKEKK